MSDTIVPKEGFMRICECPTLDFLLDQCEAILRKRTTVGWFFRGQADSAWTLLPSLLRPSARIADPEAFETHVLGFLRRVLSERSTVPDRFVMQDNVLLAMAQHYGVRTRLSDWTMDPLVALYFAASDALRCAQAEGSMSVFVISDACVSLADEPKSQFVHPPRAANPNLAAQRGVLLRHAWTKPDLWAGSPTTIDNAAEAMTNHVATRFVRFDLDRKHASSALSRVHARGVDAARLFPSESGVARHAEDLALLFERQGVRPVDRKVPAAGP